jgi:hypothetical protein
MVDFLIARGPSSSLGRSVKPETPKRGGPEATSLRLPIGPRRQLIPQSKNPYLWAHLPDPPLKRTLNAGPMKCNERYICHSTC